MPVAVRGGDCRSAGGWRDSHSAGKGPPPLSATAGRHNFFFHPGNCLPICGIGDVVALEIYFPNFRGIIVFYPCLYCPLTEWVKFLGVLVVSATKFRSGKGFHYYNL